MSVFHNNALIGASGQAAGGAYEIERSLRFNSSDSAYLSRTPASAGNRKTWTWAGWVKRSALIAGTQYTLFSGGDGASNTGTLLIYWLNNTLGIGGNVNNFLVTTQVFRDPSAWYHILVSLDTTQSTVSNRLKFFVNGTEITAFSLDDRATYVTQNIDLGINVAEAHHLGSQSRVGPTAYFDGYLADIHFIDGQALDPTSFGEFDTNGVWQPIDASGLTYGTNGFHLPFSDNSTAAALGTDTSGNNHTWTVNNISVAAGSGNDSLVDTPTNYGDDTGAGGEVRGNYCTWNPLCRSSAYATISNGNLDLAVTTNDYGYSGTLFVPNSGKWYFEITLSATSGNGPAIGIVSAKAEASDMYDSSYASGLEYGGPVYAYNPGQGTKMSQSASTSYVTASSPSANDVFMIAVDFDNGAIYFGKNGTWLNSGVPTSGASKTGAAFTSIDAESYAPVIHAWGTGITGVLNAGQRPFAYTAPSGFKALCTTNLPEPTLADGSTVMDVALYTGNGSTQTISGLGFSPDLVWIKVRNTTYGHYFTDTVRGATKNLHSNETSAETTKSAGLTAFNSDGFTLGSDSGYNESPNTYVAWTWDAGESTVTNNDGSIESQVRANPSAGFSIVTYTGDGAASATIGHGLNVAPQMIMVKNRDVADEGAVYHVGVDAASPQNYFLKLFSTSNGNAARSDVGAMWNDTAPTSSVFSVGTEDNVNASTEKYVAYCFAPVAGYSAFGSYTGNGLPDGPFVYTGFRPRWILIKQTNTAGNNWTLIDSARNTYNVVDEWLSPDTSGATYTFSTGDFLSNGFKLRNTGTGTNANGGTYIYAAFAESPQKFSRAR